MRGYYYILNAAGEVQRTDDLHVWGDWFATADRHVALTQIDEDVSVSTVFLGLDHNFTDRGRPILWETLVFGGDLDGEMYRYGSRDEAAQGHDEMCARVRAGREG